jgi:hypothetical protein
MTQIEDLVRQALAQTPTQTTPTSDPVGTLDRRVRRARRRIALTAAGAAAAVVAAVVVPLVTTGGGHTAEVQVGHSPSPSPSATTRSVSGADVWFDGNVYGMATNDAGGHAFVVTEQGNGATRRLVELDAQGKTVRHYTVPESALFVAHRDSSLWVWGGGDGAFPDSQVTALTVGSDATATLSLGRGQAVRSLAITKGGDAWAVTVDQVVHLRYSQGAVHVVEQIPLIGAQRIVASREETLWVQADTQLVELAPGAAGPDRAFRDTGLHWAGALLAAGKEGNRLWVDIGSRQVVLLDPLTVDPRNIGPDAYAGPPLDVPGRPTALAEDGLGGLYVALAGGGVAFYSFAAVTAGGPPTDRLPSTALEVETMAATPDGSLLMQDFGGRLLHWKPRSS